MGLSGGVVVVDVVVSGIFGFFGNEGKPGMDGVAVDKASPSPEPFQFSEAYMTFAIATTSDAMIATLKADEKPRPPPETR